MDEPFTTPDGLDLAYPRDPAAPPGETVNCGCQSLPYMESWAGRDALLHPDRRPSTDEEIAAQPWRAGLMGRRSAPLPGAPEGWQRWRREAAGRGRSQEAVELGTIPVRIARRARRVGLDVSRGRRITFSRSDLRHAVDRAHKNIAAADLDRIPQIIEQPDAVLHDRRNGALIYAGRAADGRRMVKVVIRSGKRTLKMGRSAAKKVVRTNYVRTLGYEEPSNLRKGNQWQILDGSVEAADAGREPAVTSSDDELANMGRLRPGRWE